MDKNAVANAGKTILEAKFLPPRGRQTFPTGTTPIIDRPWLTNTTLVPENRVVTVCDEKDQYRFGFNGMEKVNEIRGIGNTIDLGARHLDTRIGRTPTLDPAAREYPGISPYAFVVNNPINAIDPDGKRVYFVAGAGNDQDGWKYVSRFANIWTKKGLEGFTRVNASGGQLKDMAFSATYKNFSHVGRGRDGQIKRRDHKQIERAVNGIVADLEKRPLKDGEQLNLAGYSYGSVLQAHVALRLADKGIKIDNLILIGSPISDKSELFNAFRNNPNIGKVIRHDIEGDKLSNPQTEGDFKDGVEQSSPERLGGMGDEAPHFDLARPGAEADKKIGELGEKLKTEGVR